MGKLYKLKEWVTVEEAASIITKICEEDVTYADVLRLALDGHLRLSVYFVNYAMGKRGKVSRHSPEELSAAISSGNLPTDLKWHTWPRGAMAALRPDLSPEEAEKHTVMLMSLRLDKDRYLTLDDRVTTLKGVWDLPMIGNEHLDIEHEYQQLTSGLEVTLEGLDGAFVEGVDGTICQLQESYDDNPYQKGSNAQLKRLEEKIAADNLGAEESKELLDRHKKDRAEWIAEKKTRPDSDNYYPAGGLPKDSLLVVRTAALRDFERRVKELETASQEPTGTEISGKSESSYLNIIGSLCDLYWKTAHPNNPKLNQAALIEALSSYNGFAGMSERNLKDKLSKAIRAIRLE